MAPPPPAGPPRSREEALKILTAPGQFGEMEEKVIDGIKMRVWKNSPTTAREVYISAVEKFGPREYIVFHSKANGAPEEIRITYSQAGKIVAALANLMQDEFGAKKGTHIAIAMRNYPEYLLISWAALAIGAVLVNINAFLRPKEMEYCILHADSTLLFVDGERARSFQPLMSTFKIAGIRAVIECRPLNGTCQTGTVSYESLVAKYLALDKPLPDAIVDAEDESVIFYTSGTTGTPKAALSTHRSFVGGIMGRSATSYLALLRAGYSTVQIAAISKAAPQETRLMTTPLFHVTANTAVAIPLTSSGGRIVLMHKWDATHALEIIEKEKVASLVCVPTMILQILEHPRLSSYDLSSLTLFASGGAPPPVSMPEQVHATLPNRMASNGWGQSETLIGVILIGGEDYRRRPTSVGHPIAVMDVKFTDPDDPTKEVEQGKIGEILVKGPQVMKGYYKNPEATRKTITPDGWLRTGDLGYVDKEGFCYIVDRAKDMLIRGGENVYCVEVENCLYAHEAVSDAAVVGLPHRTLGEEVAAAVQVKPEFLGKVSEQDLIAHCKANIAPFKCPVFVQIRPEPLPRNVNGKILKRELRTEVVAAAKQAGVVKEQAKL